MLTYSYKPCNVWYFDNKAEMAEQILHIYNVGAAVGALCYHITFSYSHITTAPSYVIIIISVCLGVKSTI